MSKFLRIANLTDGKVAPTTWGAGTIAYDARAENFVALDKNRSWIPYLRADGKNFNVNSFPKLKTGKLVQFKTGNASLSTNAKLKDNLITLDFTAQLSVTVQASGGDVITFSLTKGGTEVRKYEQTIGTGVTLFPLSFLYHDKAGSDNESLAYAVNITAGDSSSTITNKHSTLIYQEYSGEF